MGTKKAQGTAVNKAAENMPMAPSMDVAAMCAEKRPDPAWEEGEALHKESRRALQRELAHAATTGNNWRILAIAKTIDAHRG